MGTIRAFGVCSAACVVSLALLAAGCTDTSSDQDEPQRDRTRGNSSGSDSNTSSGGTSSDNAPTPAGGSAGTSVPRGSGDALTAAADVEVFAALLIQRQKVQMGLLSVTTYYCSSPDPLNTDAGNGSMVIEIDDVDPPGQSTGDSFKITYNDCVQFGGTYNGSSAFKIDEISGTPYAAPPQLWRVATSHASEIAIERGGSTTTTASTFGFSSGTADGVAYERIVKGSFDFAAGSGTPITTLYDNNYGWNVSTNTFTHSVNSSFSSSFGSYKLETLTPVTGTLDTPPTAGKARITQDFGSTTMITTFTVLTDGMVQVELDANGDGTVDVTYTVPWRSSQVAGSFV